MNKHQLLAGAAGASLLFAATGCESLVDDLNDDPNNFTSITLPLALRQAQLNQASLVGGLPAHLAAMWSDQFTGADRQYVSFDDYAINAGSFDEIWEDIYQRGLVHAVLAQEVAAEQSADIERGVGLILQGYYLGEAASMFGDVPFQQANNIEEFRDPQYESQGEVLRGAIDLIDQGLALVGDANVSVTGAEVYAFDPTWAEVGNGFKARYLLGLMDYDGALAAANASGITDPSSDLAIVGLSVDEGENLYWQFEVEDRNGYLVVDSDVRGASYFRRILSDTLDLSRSRDDDKTDDSARYAYFIEVNDDASNVRYNLTDGFAAATAPLTVISAAEVQLIRAEAAARTGDEDDAIEALNAARNYWDTLLGTDNYDDLDDDDFDDNDDDDLLEAILIEKFVSVIGLPTFYDVNRTDNLIGTTSEATGPIAQRFLYPSTELSSNENFPGLQSLTTPLPLYN